MVLEAATLAAQEKAADNARASTDVGGGAGSNLSLGVAPTGIVVPHHTVAMDLIEAGFNAARAGKYDRIIILFPDHFRRSRASFATTSKDLSTASGDVRIDKPSVDQLLRSPFVEDSGLFAKDHGIQVLLPLIRRFFPETPVVPVALRIDSRKEQWLELVSALESLFGERTLIVQSTDFSHYLTHRQARRHDQQTMNALATGDPNALLTLDQPAHLDSVAAQFVHMELQRRRGNVGPVVLANKNSQQYSPVLERQTTSYILQLFHAPKRFPSALPNELCEETWIFAGDTFLGRNLGPTLALPEKRAALRDAILSATAGHPIAINLEGVLLPSVSDADSQHRLVMEQSVAVDFLKSINVRVASLANNHSYDAGSTGLKNTARILRESGIHPVEEGDIYDAGKFRLTALSDFCNMRSPLGGRIDSRAAIKLTRAQGLRFPAFAMVHWGKEFDPEPQASQSRIADWLQGTEISLICGAHPHVASLNLQLWRGNDGLVAWTLGNFVFDQPRGSGALLEVRFFRNGTYATRILPIGNLLAGIREEIKSSTARR